MFYLMEKKELNRTYGQFDGWGTAYSQFDNIFQNGKRGDQAPGTQRSVYRSYSHIDTLRKLRGLKSAKLEPVPQPNVDAKVTPVVAKKQDSKAVPELAKVVGKELVKSQILETKKVTLPEVKKEEKVDAPVEKKQMRRTKSHIIKSNRANLRLFNMARKGTKYTAGLGNGPATTPFVNRNLLQAPFQYSNLIQSEQVSKEGKPLQLLPHINQETIS